MYKIFKNKLGFLFLLIGFLLFSNIVFGQVWVEDTYKDFSDGYLGNSGQNLFISHNGVIRTIHRFDLNEDGYVDLLFNSTHDYDYYVPATIIKMSKDRKMDISKLAIRGSLSAEVSDLNKDGYPDLIFCPNRSGLQNPYRLLTIAWGGAKGWSDSRINGLLPVHGCKSIAVADLNQDGWPDIITLNQKSWMPNQPQGNIIRIYWGSKMGFSLNHFQDVGVDNAYSLVSGDFNSDKKSDLAILAKDKIKILWSTNQRAETGFGKIKLDSTPINLPYNNIKCMAVVDIDGNGYQDFVVGANRNIYIIKNSRGDKWNRAKVISDLDATSITINDIDNDGSFDLIVSSSLTDPFSGGRVEETKTRKTNSKILWGNHGHFSKEEIILFDVPYSVGTAVTDLDEDGNKDIICAVAHGENRYSAESTIFFGKGNREFERSGKGIPGQGANFVTVIPSVKSQGSPTVVICNHMKGTLYEKVPLYLYWGGKDGFSVDHLTKIPFRGGYQSTAADINGDGYVDLVSINSNNGNHERDTTAGANIFWGSKNGFDFKKPTILYDEDRAANCNIADLNRDGYLDLVIGFFGKSNKDSTDLVIYYGSNDGFLRRNRIAIPSPGRSTSPTIADFDKDGWLDIAVCSYYKDLVRIFWGSSRGFDVRQQQDIIVPSIIDLETADLNNDGYLDIIACSYGDKINHHHDTGVKILWGSKKGFMYWNAQWLPSFTPLGPVMADFDGDGYLDLFCPTYLQDLNRENLPMYLYWGSSDGFNYLRKTTLFGSSSSDALAADFNRDGKIDLAVAAHTTNGHHSSAKTKVYYNDGQRFKSDCKKIKRLPSPGGHWMWNVDMGNIYNRRWKEEYVSSIFHWGQADKTGKIKFKAKIPEGAKIIFYIRSSTGKKSLDSSGWQKVKEGKFKLKGKDRYLQYKAVFISDNGDRYPALNKVAITLLP